MFACSVTFEDFHLVYQLKGATLFNSYTCIRIILIFMFIIISMLFHYLFDIPRAIKPLRILQIPVFNQSKAQNSINLVDLLLRSCFLIVIWQMGSSR